MKMKMKKIGLVLLFLALPVVSIAAQQKYALVIGNGAYQNLARLNNPVNDANDMAAALKGLGFAVESVVNGSRVQMEDAVERFKNRLSVSRNSYGFLFYAGHGVQSGGVNYLIPVDAEIKSESYLRDRAVSVQAVLDEINQAGNELNIVVLDACRDNPFSWGRSGSRGLQVVGNQPADSIIVYATSAGSVASDGTGRNGLFTGHLLKNLKTPGLDVNEVFRLTGGDVAKASGGGQRPAVYNQFYGIAYLGSRPSAPPAPQSAPPAPQSAPPAPQSAQPAPQSAPAAAQPAPKPAVPQAGPVPAGMAYVQGGTFQMGSGSGYDNEKPVHTVTVGDFYMGAYEVTQREWQETMGTSVAQQRDMANTAWPLYGVGDTHPMYCVSWYEAVEYCNRRSIKEGLTPAYGGSGDNISCDFRANGYRLPTEAEWEYAAKGGNKAVLTYEYSGSNGAESVAWYDGNSGSGAHAVGTKQPNGLGLYDMSGNVWEWCWDRYGSYSSGSQTAPAGAVSGSYRVRRGGSWHDYAQGLRSAFRSNNTPSDRYYDLGFRLVRPFQP